MDRRVALGALWALFAAASVGVGFGAAGLVGDPFTDPAKISTGSVVSSSGSATASPDPTDSATGSASGSATRGPGSSSAAGDPSSSGSSTRGPSGRGPSAGPSTRSQSSGPSSSRPSSSRSPGTTEVRGISTRGGYVSASCRDGLVSVSASPAVGWAIDDVDSGRVENARVRFEGTDDSDQRVEVRASCVGGIPRFAVEDRDRGGGGGDGGGGSGSSGSSGGDD